MTEPTPVNSTATEKNAKTLNARFSCVAGLITRFGAALAGGWGVFGLADMMGGQSVHGSGKRVPRPQDGGSGGLVKVETKMTGREVRSRPATAPSLGFN